MAGNGRSNADAAAMLRGPRRTRAPGGDDGTRKPSRGGLGFVAAADAAEPTPGYSTSSFAAMFTPASVQDSSGDTNDAPDEENDAPRGLGFTRAADEPAAAPRSGLSNAAFAAMFTSASRPDHTDATESHQTNPQSDATPMDDNEPNDAPPERSGFSNTDFAAMFRTATVETADDTAGASNSTKPSAPAPPPAPEPVPEPKRAPILPPANIASMGKWEKHTKGFGMKMLAKMGFKGRLGKDEQGIAVPVAVKARPNQLGLGAAGFKEASSLAQNQQVERELHGKTIEDEEEVARKEQVFGTDDGAWRKRLGAPKKRKRKSAKDLFVDDDDEDAPMPTTRIIDMRGPDVVTYENGLSELQKQSLLAAPVLGQELLYNLRTIVNEAEGAIRVGRQRIAVERSRLHVLQNAASATSEKHHADAQSQANLAAIRCALQHLHAEMAGASAPRGLELITDTLVGLRQQYPVEFESQRIIDVLPSLGLPLLKSLLVSWDPLDDVDDAALAFQSCFTWVRDCLTTCVATPSAQDAGLFAVNLDTRHDKLYQHLCEVVLVPHVTSALHRWDVRRPCLGLIAFLDSFAHPQIVSHLLSAAILPKLQHAVRSWNPQTDPVHLHEWLLPWSTRFLKDEFDKPLFPLIRETLSRALAQWHPRDASIFTVLSPWQAVWTPEDFAVFTHKTIARKLLRCLNRELSVEPGSTNDVAPLQWTFQWHGLLPDRQLIALLEGEVFSKWLHVLRRWVEKARAAAIEDRKTMVSEMVVWFHGWKALFAPLWHLDRIRLQFAMGLQLLKCVERGTLPSLDVLASTYDKALVLGGKQAARARDVPVATDVLHIRDVLEALALDAGIDFVPHPRNHRVSGKPVYCFGSLSVYFEADVVFAEAAKGSFAPMDIESLLRRARAS
ncbi:hypothetical protein SPRG_07487 [Saprolegnia parasitica CBS 223.65]|uniref:G-patch domain-containing protein n=1 Tax=Saprolegnia parasitica (strain CBS 223.65) TaxID=695850 RepID=A0A067C9U1_SAPPC|nr:hypothetical protein SPRG_07487 [Saprolegnia parasitica CBS 223.65]KDO27238.1 hypothetical protein SPRG_07487 [Saprolegnia parasitica CBS 223.65]|eukprot:XP_012202015.1 hypothetical protein SPRG_07487 [Saprolegnia parasitica CBS 223.65]